MAYSKNDRSERILQGKRFTTDNLTLFQEAFTDVLDLGAKEIYTDDGLIPTGSSQLDFNSLADNGKIVSASVVDTSISPGSSEDFNILKYHFRKKMKRAADGQNEVYYFTTSDPSDVDSTVTSDQTIESDQQTNFISPKYMIPADAANTAEDPSTGYAVNVFKSTSSDISSTSIAAESDSTYVFDYKTGVLSWLSGNAPGASEFVYITAYQYIGRTLRSQIDDGSIGGGSSDFTAAGISGSLGPNATLIRSLTAAGISGSLSGTAIAGLGAGILSGSAQIANDISGSLSATAIAGLDAGILSGSAQIATEISGAFNTPLTAVTSSLNLNQGVVFTNNQGQLQQDAGFTYDSNADKLTVSKLTTVEFTASFVTASTIETSGSNILGDEADVDVQTLIGSTVMSGSAAVSGSMFVSGSLSFNEIDCGTF